MYAHACRYFHLSLIGQYQSIVIRVWDFLFVLYELLFPFFQSQTLSGQVQGCSQNMVGSGIVLNFSLLSITRNFLRWC